MVTATEIVHSLADVGAEDVWDRRASSGTSLTMPGGRPCEPARRLAAERHDHPRHRRHAPGEPAGDPSAAASAAAPASRAGLRARASRGTRATSRGRRGKPDQRALGAGRAEQRESSSRLNTRAPAMAPIVLAA